MATAKEEREKTRRPAEQEVAKKLIKTIPK